MFRVKPKEIKDLSSNPLIQVHKYETAGSDWLKHEGQNVLKLFDLGLSVPASPVLPALEEMGEPTAHYHCIFT